MEFCPEDKLILSCIKIYHCPLELEQINNLIMQIRDWDYLIKTIIDRGIAPLFFKKLPLLTNSSQIPDTIKAKLQQAYFITFCRSTILYEHFRKIAGAFVEHNISLIGLKGIYLSEWLYQDIGLRQFSDIDLLVKDDDASTCINILSEFGYSVLENKNLLSEFALKQIKNDIVHYPPMIKDGASIEIHIKLHYENEKYNVKTSSLWSNAVPVTINGISVSALNNIDLLIHLCLHLDKHFKGGHVQFTCFNDITNLLDRYVESMDWDKLTEVCLLYNCEKVVFKYIVMIHNFMNVNIPMSILKKYSYLLKQKDKQLFCRYLKGDDIKLFKSYYKFHIKSLKNIVGYSDKFLYLKDILIPSKAFMVEAYQIKRPWLVFFYYPYRYYIGVRGMVNHIFIK